MNSICKLLIASILVFTSGEVQAASGIIYSGQIDLVLGGLPSTPTADVYIDGGEPEFSVGSNAVAPVGDVGGYTYLTTQFSLGLLGETSGAIKSFSMGDFVDTSPALYASPQLLPPPPDQSGFLLTGFDFGNPGPGPAALGAYFSETTPQDFYWAFSFVPDGTIGIVAGWMRVTVNPVTVDLNNETLSGGEFILREYAYNPVGDTIRIGEIPEPSSIVLIGMSLLALASRRLGRGNAVPPRPS